jgi:hypothetical protein
MCFILIQFHHSSAVLDTLMDLFLNLIMLVCCIASRTAHQLQYCPRAFYIDVNLFVLESRLGDRLP